MELITHLQNNAVQFENRKAFTYLRSDSKLDYSFAELITGVKKFSYFLQANNQLQDRVLLMMSTSYEFMVAMLACFWSGQIAVPLSMPKLSDKKSSILSYIRGISQDAETKYLVTTKADYSLFSEYLCDADFIEVILIDDIINSNVPEQPHVTVKPDDIALILYTSGSTGSPKGVMLTHHNLAHNLLSFSKYCKLDYSHRICAWIPNTHIAGIYIRLLGCCITGAQTIVFSPRDFLESPLRWISIISEYQITVSAASNFAYELCCNPAIQEQLSSMDNIDLSHWRMAVSGGERIQYETVSKFSRLFAQYGFREEYFKPYYGLTETTCVSVASLEQSIEICQLDREKLKTNVAISVTGKDSNNALTLIGNGSAFADTDVKIVDPATHLICEKNVIGEIWVSGESVCKGYWKKPKETNENCLARITDHGDNQKAYFRTGDLGFLKNDTIFVTGRLKELIVIRGKNYYPEDIERVIRVCCHEYGIQHTVALSIDGSETEQLALVLGYKDRKLSAAENLKLTASLNSILNASLGLCLDFLTLVNSAYLPMTATGKVRRQACREYIISGIWPNYLADKKEVSSNSVQAIEFSWNDLRTQPRPKQIVILCDIICKILSNIMERSFTKESNKMPLQELGLDSISTVRFFVELSNTIEKTIPFSLLFQDIDIISLADYIIETKDKGVDSTLNSLEIDSEINGILDALPDGAKLNQPSGDIQNIFFTGSTGFLGRYLLHDLLEKTEATLYCLVRASDVKSAFSRIKDSLADRHYTNSILEKRIVPLVGNLTEPEFGLESEVFLELTQKIDIILHNAADVNFVKPYSLIKTSNFLPLKTLLQFASAYKLKPLHFVSTVAVFNSPERYNYSPIKETDKLTSVEKIFSGYAQSKWVSEELLQRASNEKNMVVKCYRPGLVTGDSRNGYAHTDDFLCRFIKGCLQMKTYPCVDMEIDMSPVDFVSSSIVTLLSKSNVNYEKFKAFHLINSKPIRLVDFFNWLKNYGFEINPLALQDWLNNARTNLSKDNALYPVMPFLTQPNEAASMTILELFDGHNLDYDISNTKEFLKAEGIVCPTITDDLLRRYVQHFIESGFFEGLKVRQVHNCDME